MDSGSRRERLDRAIPMRSPKFQLEMSVSCVALSCRATAGETARIVCMCSIVPIGTLNVPPRYMELVLCIFIFIVFPFR